MKKHKKKFRYGDSFNFRVDVDILDGFGHRIKKKRDLNVKDALLHIGTYAEAEEGISINKLLRGKKKK